MLTGNGGGPASCTDDIIESLVCPPPPSDNALNEEVISSLIVPAPGWNCGGGGGGKEAVSPDGDSTTAPPSQSSEHSEVHHNNIQIQTSTAKKQQVNVNRSQMVVNPAIVMRGIQSGGHSEPPAVHQARGGKLSSPSESFDSNQSAAAATGLHGQLPVGSLVAAASGSNGSAPTAVLANNINNIVPGQSRILSDTIRMKKVCT